MSKVTELASGAITGADQIVVELVQPIDLPGTIVIRWPDQPSVTTPGKYAATAAATMQVLAAARMKP